MESPFTARFGTNYVPSDEEIKSIKLHLASCAQELAQVGELGAQRDRIQTSMDSHKALISYPRRLPPDIVREIFVACLQVPTNRNAVMSAQEAPLLLCRIYSAWRAIALSTPTLWASLHVSFDFVQSKRLQRLPAVAHWLELSAACPISLSVNFRHVLNGATWDLTTTVELLAASLPRWRHVEFLDLSQDTASQLIENQLLQRTPPLLQSLKITGSVSVLSRLKGICTSPHLNTLALESQAREQLGDLILGLPLPWFQLTHLTLTSSGDGGLSLDNIITLLGRCPKLISLLFTAKDGAVKEAVSAPSVRSSLQRLVVEYYSRPDSLKHLIERVSMPQLRQFRAPTIPFKDHSFFVALGRESPLIEDLNFNIWSLAAQSLPATLQSLPSLTKLVVDGIESGATWPWGVEDISSDLAEPAQLLTLLTPNSGTTLCPRLQELVVYDCGILDQSTVKTFVRARMDMAQPHLRHLRLISHDASVTGLLSEAEIQSYLFIRKIFFSWLSWPSWGSWRGWCQLARITARTHFF
ncbi:hypothetical protein DFH06DRAFT_1479659 [Mycena polygramma]|nr:hypothetical protein DFH06DRAFT_1479659 [Mycena polygramma]